MCGPGVHLLHSKTVPLSCVLAPPYPVTRSPPPLACTTIDILPMENWHGRHLAKRFAWQTIFDFSSGPTFWPPPFWHFPLGGYAQFEAHVRKLSSSESCEHQQEKVSNYRDMWGAPGLRMVLYAKPRFGNFWLENLLDGTERWDFFNSPIEFHAYFSRTACLRTINSWNKYSRPRSRP